ncbi:hypothetical protein TA3x_004790 [Tundrisphaera sp. TA3]|uniref:hypothetical protein n=1 Tax=Tundrisphaera sp. TA3 TaxID=3435775 RepID=UPI003EC116C2
MIESYQTYRGLPPLAGLATHEEAARPGLSVEACVARLKRYHYAFKRLHEILTGRIIAEPIYELKTAFSHHAYLCSEHVQALRDRVGEMRQPPLGLEEVPDPALEVLFDEVRAAPTTAGLIVGIYEVALPALDRGMARHAIDTNPLTDAPSLRICRFARLELADMIDFGRKAIACLVGEADREAMRPWVDSLEAALASAGGLDGTAEPSGSPAHRTHSAEPFRFDLVPRRDERFRDLYNQGVNAEAFLYTEGLPDRAKALMMLYKRIREIDVPEMMASIIVETEGKPWGYYRDMTRQLWDEARHAMMGEVGFVASGIDWTEARITHNWSLRLNTECTPLERHGVLYFIEQGLMPKTGKRYEWEVGVRSGDPLMATIQDYDWADEVLHAAIGREWYLPQFDHWREGLAFGDRAWSKILSNWAEVREQGLTDHENWWPAIYRQACERWGIEPDPAVLAFDVTYADRRADLKGVGASG